jgi:cytochrome c peroxidase
MRSTRKASLRDRLVILATLTVSGLTAYGSQATAAPGTDPPAQAPAPAPMAAPAKPVGRAAFVRPASMLFPKENAFSPERELLGRTLFFDPRLSRSEAISCASCHNPGFAWGDGLAKGIGHGGKALGRRSPTIIDVAWAPALFWDGRASSLEEQALGPIASPGEMNMPLDVMEKRVRAIPGYAPLFAAAYPGAPVGRDSIAKAIATFERTVVSSIAPFDSWVAGDESAISEGAKRGFALFTGKARCNACHAGWRFTDDSFQDIGVPGKDVGRGKLLKDIPTMQYAFKTPTLRNVDRRAPFMHDGSESTLESVVDLYALGGRAKRPSLSGDIKPFPMTAEERSDLVAFLRTLTSADPMPSLPLMPR